MFYTIREAAEILGPPFTFNGLRTKVDRRQVAFSTNEAGQRGFTFDQLAELRKTDRVPYQKVIDDWQAAMRSGLLSGKPLSENTITGRLDMIDLLWRTLGMSGAVSALTFQNIERAVFLLPPESYSRRRNMKDACRSLSLFLLKRGLCQPELPRSINDIVIKRCKPAKRLYLHKDGIAKLFKANTYEKGRSQTDKLGTDLIIALTFYCGLRRQEVANLELKDVDMVNNRLMVIGKGSKYREVGLSREPREIIQLWLDYRQDVLTKKYGQLPDSLLISRFREPVSGNGIAQRINKLQKKIQVTEPSFRINVHGLRHSHATVALSEGLVTLENLSESMGHADIRLTKGTYVHASGHVKALQGIEWG